MKSRLVEYSTGTAFRFLSLECLSKHRSVLCTYLTHSRKSLCKIPDRLVIGGKAEPVIVVTVIGCIPVAVRNAKIVIVVVPRTPAQNASYEHNT
jgi:hypothetical protein